MNFLLISYLLDLQLISDGTTTEDLAEPEQTLGIGEPATDDDE